MSLLCPPPPFRSLARPSSFISLTVCANKPVPNKNPKKETRCLIYRGEVVLSLTLFSQDRLISNSNRICNRQKAETVKMLGCSKKFFYFVIFVLSSQTTPSLVPPVFRSNVGRRDGENSFVRVLVTSGTLRECCLFLHHAVSCCCY